MHKLEDLNTNLIYTLGRAVVNKDSICLSLSASALKLSFVGTSLKLDLNSIEIGFGIPEYTYILDDKEELLAFSGEKVLEINDLEYKEHKFEILKRNEFKFNKLIISNIETDGKFVKRNEKKLKIEVYGDSITSGYAIYNKRANNHTTNALDTYCYLTAKSLDADISVFSSSGMGLIVGDTNYNCYLKFDYYDQFSSVKWDFNKFIPDVLLINLGTNDIFYGADKASIKKYYSLFLDKLRNIYKETKIVCLAGMMINDINDLIKEVVSLKENIYYLELPTSPSNRHPLLEEHIECSKVLTNFLKKII